MTEGQGNADDGRAPFLAAEASLQGQPLSALVERARGRGERLAPELVAWIGARAAEGLRDVHALLDDAGNPLAVSHGAVTPENVFLTRDGRVVLAGDGDDAADPRADIVALARTLYEAALGEPPSPAGERPPGVRPPASIVPGFPEELAGILVRILEEESTLATPSAAELAAELDHFAGRNASESSLAELLAAWFEDEREAQLVVEGVPALRDLVRSLPPGPVSAAPLAASLRPASHEKPSRWGLVVLACAVLLAAGSVLMVKLPRDGSEATPGPAGRPVASPSPVPAPSAPVGIGTGTAALAAEKADAGGARFVP